VGAIQEDDDQQGLAHFLEHMAFNGTRDMPGKMMIEYLESIGVKFGANLNAYTSWDNTVYMMKDVPSTREMVIDSALLILQNWAGFIEPHKEEIDKERGVIKEELRTRDGAGWRQTMSLIETLGRGTKYEERNLIGTLEGLDSFEAESLTRFYHEWYRPDYQAIIIVGDIDVDHVEQRVKELFSEIPTPSADAPQKETIYTIDNEEPIIKIFTDPEQTYTQIQYFMKRREREKSQNKTLATAREQMVETLISMMQQERLSEVSMLPNAPILDGYMGIGRVGVIPTLSATSYYVQSDETEIEEAMRETITQIERVRRHGFLDEELERAKLNVLRGVERSYANRNDRENDSFVQQYISNFRFGTAIPSAEDEWKIDTKLIENITLEDINSAIDGLYPTNNHIVMVAMPQKEGLVAPSEKRIMEIIDEVLASDIEPLEKSGESRDLLPKGSVLNGSPVVSERYSELYEATEWTLANGITVIVKPTQFKADEVLLRGYADGGKSILPDSLYRASGLLASLLSNSGVSEFSAVELKRQLSGKIASVSNSVGGYSQNISGSCSPNDIETMMQLLYLRFTAPRYSEDDFEVLRRQYRASLENQMSNPDYIQYKKYTEVVFDNHFRKRLLDVESLDELKLSDFAAVQQQLFSDADNFTFILVGTLDLESLKPLVEKYIGSLPTDSSNKRMKYLDDNIRIADGIIKEEFSVPMQQPKVGVSTLISGKGIKYTMRNIIVGNFYETALNDLLLNSVREEMGGTYGAHSNLSIEKSPYSHFSLEISYDTNEKQFEQMQTTLFEQLEILAREGATEAQMTKCREYLLKSFVNAKERNGNWIAFLKSLRENGFDYISDYEDIVRNVTSKDVRKMAQQILKQQRCIELIMLPEK
ncbi:MAG: insulinase family protein, partial [Rikenellaceae bacterium]